MRALWLLLPLAGCGEAAFADLPAPTTVFVFLQPDCPIANRTAPEVLRLRAAFPAAAFRVVYPGKRHSLDALRAHRDAYLPGVPALFDPDLRLAKRCRVAVTPEAAVVTAKDGLVYHGRIDDLHADLDVVRPAPTRRDLELALTALSRGEPPPPSARAVGCPVTE